MTHGVSLSGKRSRAKISGGFFAALVILTLTFICAPAAWAADHPYSYSNGDSEATIQNGIQNQIDTALPNDTVTVSGTKNNATATIALDIPSNVTVIWTANLIGSGSFAGAQSLLRITGAGTFRTTAGSNIQVNSGNGAAAINAVHSSTVTLNLDGGTILASGSGCAAVAIDGGTPGIKANVNGAVISVSGNSCYAIAAAGASAHINLNGGSVSASGADSYALYVMPGATYSGSGTAISGQVYTEPSGDSGGGGCDAGIGGLLALSLAGFLIFKKRRA